VSAAPDRAAELEASLAATGLAVLGGLRPEPGDGLPEGSRTLLLVGPEPGAFWPAFAASPEAGDNRPHPLDRWTTRILGGIASAFGATALYPFGGPPWHPFPSWALRTGRVFTAPVGLLVHDRLGLFVSFRGALALTEALPLPQAAARPCDTCPAPCATACPAGALTRAGYDVPACRAWIAAPAGADCLAEGCAVRRACPVGRDAWPPVGQRRFHMRAFHGTQVA
jgi:epoxyqueuosine reductase